jgi:hypothetical protein
MEMDKSQLVLALLGSAVVGALFSSLVIALSQWRERVARRKELLLNFSVDLAKVYVGRVASMKGNSTLLEMAVIPRFHEMLTQIFENGELSDEHHQFLIKHLDELEARAAERVANIASALREAKESHS